MKLTIWQQFSSNHSAGFTVIGEFESVEQAAKAKAELESIIAQILEWRKDYWQNPEKFGDIIYEEESEHLTPIEEKLRDKYQVDWQFSLKAHPGDSKRAFLQYKHLVFVKPLYLFIWKGPQPFNELLEKFGAQVSASVDSSYTYPNTDIYMDVDCQLPNDELDAEILYEGFREDFYHLHQLTDTSEYTPNFFFAYYPEATQRIHDIPCRVYEVERHGDRLYLFGFILGMVQSWRAELPVFLDFLKNEGCSDIKYTFRSARILKYQDDD